MTPPTLHPKHLERNQAAGNLQHVSELVQLKAKLHVGGEDELSNRVCGGR